MAKISFHNCNYTFEKATKIAREVRYIDNGGAYKMCEPNLYLAPDYILNDAKARLDQGIVYAPPGIVCTFHDALVRQPGFIYVGTKIIEDSVINLIGDTDLEHWMPVTKIDSGVYAAKPEYFHFGQVVYDDVVCLVQNADANYGHWLIEGLPRLALVAQVKDLSSLKYLISSYDGKVKDFQVETLRLLGIEESQIIHLDPEPSFFRSLIYPAPLTVQPYVKAPIVIRFLREMSLRPEVGDATPGPARLFVSRNKWGRRTLLNETEIWQYLEPLGFQIVYPEDLSVTGQIRQFRNAEIVVGSLGGSLSNLVFCPEGVGLIALTTEYMNDDFFWDIISHKKGEYHSIHGRATNPEQGMQSDFSIELDLLRNVLSGVMDRQNRLQERVEISSSDM